MTVHVTQPADAPLVDQITLDRPERRNALDHDALTDLRAALRDAGARTQRAVVLHGAAGHFCAGADLSTVEDEDFVALLRDVLMTIRAAPMPVVAAIEGAALGAGTQLALACDLRIATARASFGIPAAKLGLTIDQWTVHQLSTQVGGSIARAMLTGAEVFRGDRLFDSGFVHRLVGDAGDVLDEAIEWATSLTALAPLTIGAHKAMLAAAESASDPPDDVAQARVRAWQSEDLAEGIAAFSERRPAIFKGR